MIDDISIIVIQLDFLEPFGELPSGNRGELKSNSVVSIPDSGRLISSKGDAVRGSFVPAREVARRRIDPKRGSYVSENQKTEEIEADLSIIPYSK